MRYPSAAPADPAKPHAAASFDKERDPAHPLSNEWIKNPSVYIMSEETGEVTHVRDSASMIEDWQASIANADLADWVTVAAYIVAAALCARAAMQAWLRREPREDIFWRGVAVLMLFLGINELLDLQTLITMIGRADAKAHGWYEGRREVQYYFVTGLTAATVIGGVAMIWLTRRADIAVRLALVGLAFIGLFILLRAASFHHLDMLLSSGARVFNWGSVQEMAGIMIVAGAAAFYARKRKRPARRSRSRPR